MRQTLALLLAFALAVTVFPADAPAQNANWMLQQQRQQQMMMQQQQQQRLQQQQQQQRDMQRRQQETQRRQMEQQRQRQQAALQLRQREMQNRQREMQVQRQMLADQRRAAQQQRQIQQQKAGARQAGAAQVQREVRIARDRVVQLDRQRRLQELRQRTHLQAQNRKADQASQRAASLALLGRQAGRSATLAAPGLLERRQLAAQNAAKVRVMRNGAPGAGEGKGSAALTITKQMSQQKLQEFRNRQALKGAKETKQDALTKGHLAGKSDFAKLSGILRDASKGKGNFGLGSANLEQSVAMGKAWVGKGFKIASDGKTLISADGLRQFRPASKKASSKATTGVQANFQRRESPSGNWTHNGHLNIVPR